RQPHPFPTRRSSDLAKVIRTAARDSYRLPVTVNNSVNQAMAVSIASMRALEKQVKVLDKAIEQQFEIIPNTLTSIPGIGKVYSADRKSTRLNSSHVS